MSTQDKNKPLLQGEKCRLILSNISDTVILTDDEGEIKFVCPNTRFIFGFTEKEIYARESIFSVIPGLTLEEISEEVINKEAVVKDKEGKSHYVLLNVRKIAIDDATLLYTLRDITEKKITEDDLIESEHKFKTLFSSSPDAIILANRKSGIIVDANKAAAKLFETKLQSLIGKHQSELHPKEQDVKAKDTFKHRPTSPEIDAPPVEIEIVTAKNTRKTVEIRGKIFKMNNEEFVIGNFRDVSDKKKMEQELTQYKDNLEKIVEERTKELVEKNLELEKYNELFVGREFRIKELREKIKKLENKLKGE